MQRIGGLPIRRSPDEEHLTKFDVILGRMVAILPRHVMGWTEKLRLDVWYVDHRSVMRDFRILGVTLGRVFSDAGVDLPGHATAEPF